MFSLVTINEHFFYLFDLQKSQNSLSHDIDSPNQGFLTVQIGCAGMPGLAKLEDQTDK